MNRTLIFFVIPALLLAANVGTAEATTTAALTVKTGVRSNAGNFVVGYQFTLETAMTVTDLGVIDANTDGKLNGTQPVKIAIWDTTGKQLVTTEVPVTTPAENDAFHVGIEPLNLEPGIYVIGAVTQIGGERFFCDSPVETVPGVRWDEGRFEIGSSLVFPTRKRPQAASYLGPVFKVVASATTMIKPASALRVTLPPERAIFQRDEHGVAQVPVAVTIPNPDTHTVEVRALDRQAKSTAMDWTQVTADMQLTLPGGWYQLEFRARNAENVVATAVVERVGVGEVFVTCGQSNSANFGKPRQKAQDDRVSSCNFETGLWQHGDDPQPGAGGSGGSPWPLLGNQLVRENDVPVGFICLGVGSTTVGQWSPNGSLYPRLKQALQRTGKNGVRAVLWHQGESDSIAGTPAETYAELLGAIIARSRTDAGWDVPWGVALASFHPAPEATAEKQAAVAEGQKMVAATVPGVFQGPTTDGFRERGFLRDNVHFNAQGLAAHAQGWADVLTMIPGTESQSEPSAVPQKQKESN
jgi:hypothetical protein